MNRVFKVVWNDVRGSYVVCDENKRSHGKPKSVKSAIVSAAVAALFGLGSVAGAADNPVDKVIDNGKFENVIKTEASNYPLVAEVSVTQDDTASLTVNGSVFQNNQLTLENTTGLPSAIGIASSGTNVSVNGSTFTDNSVGIAEGGTDTNGIYGSAIGVQSADLTIDKSTFSGNRAISERQTQGSALYQSIGRLAISDSSFTDNVGQNNSGAADGNVTGGAVSLWGVNGTIDGTTFSGNTAVTKDAAGSALTDNIAYGGAIYSRSGIWGGDNQTQLTVSNSTFTGNRAQGGATKALGGAIYVKGDPNVDAGQNFTHQLIVENSQFENNSTTGDGGAIYSLNAPMTISDSTFTGNTAGRNGGAIYNTADNALVFSGDNTFSGNMAGNVTNDIHNLGTIEIAGGTTTLDGGISGDTGIVNVTDGTLKTPVSSGTGQVNVNGGTLESAVIGDGSKISMNKGMLKTGSDQVVKTGLNEAGDNTDPDALRDTVTIDYKGGSLALTDARYNLDYATAVQNMIRNGQDKNTSLVMLGELNGANDGKISISELNDVGVTLANVDVTVGDQSGASLVIGAPTTDANIVAHDNDLGARTVDLGNNISNVTVTGGHALTLVGDGSALITTGNADKAVTVEVGGAGTGDAGILNLGTAAAANGGTLNGDINVAANGTVNVVGNEYSISQNLVSSGAVNVQNGATLNTGGITLNDSGALNISGTLNANNLTGSADSAIAVGNEESAGALYAGNVSLNGGMLVFDPAWTDGVGIEGASRGGVVFNNATVDGPVAVGRNSLAVLGEQSTDWASAEFARTGRTWSQNDITAALAVRAPMTLGANGAIAVDGSKTAQDFQTDRPADNTATFADNSMLMVDAGALNNQAAITSTGGTATVAGGAALHVANLKVNQTATVLDGFTGGTGTAAIAEGGWTGNNLTTTDAMINSLELANTGGTVTVKATGVSRAADAFPGIMPASIMDSIWQNGQNDTDSANAGIAFLSRASDSRYVARSDAARQVNGAAQIAVAAGTQAVTVQAVDAITGALDNHLSLTSNISQPGAPLLHKEGADLWASVLYRSTDSSGLKAGNFSSNYDNDFGGIIVGTDYTGIAIGSQKYRMGVALSYGKGDSKSKGDFNHTKNDYDTYGASIYGGWNSENANVVIDVGYMKGDNDLKQDMAASLGGNLKADVDTKVWTAGVKAEYRVPTGAMDVTPHIGARYINLKTDAFDTRNNLGTLFRTDSETQNLWQFPIGVTFSGNYLSNDGWTVKPKLDVSVIPVSGDRDVKTSVSVPGVNAVDSASADMMDNLSWRGMLGLEVQKGNTSFGLQAGYQKSDDAKSRGVMLSFGHQFD